MTLFHNDFRRLTEQQLSSRTEAGGTTLSYILDYR